MTLGFSSGRAAVSGEKDGPAGRFVIATQDLDLGTQVKTSILLYKVKLVQRDRFFSTDRQTCCLLYIGLNNTKTILLSTKINVETLKLDIFS